MLHLYLFSTKLTQNPDFLHLWSVFIHSSVIPTDSREQSAYHLKKGDIDGFLLEDVYWMFFFLPEKTLIMWRLPKVRKTKLGNDKSCFHSLLNCFVGVLEWKLLDFQIYEKFWKLLSKLNRIWTADITNNWLSISLKFRIGK